MEKDFMYILEIGYWTLTDLKTKAMRAAYDEAKRHNRKIVYPDKIVTVINKIMDDVVFVAHSSNGVKMPKIYRLNNDIHMNDSTLIRATKLYIENIDDQTVKNQ